MTKDLNETRKGVKDPERSAAAKGRKPPPNPWAKIKELEALLRASEQERDRRAHNEEIGKQRLAAAFHIHKLYAEQSQAQGTLIRELSKPWYARNKGMIAAARRAVLDCAERLTRAVMPRSELAGENAATDQPGAIAGLVTRTIGPQPDGSFNQQGAPSQPLEIPSIKHTTGPHR